MRHSLFFVIAVCSFLALSAEDFSTQLPPINATNSVEELELPELPLWQDENSESAETLYSAYLLPTPESQLVISLAPPEAIVPDEIKILPPLEE